MCKRFVYLFLVFGFCLAAARGGTLTMAPLTSWEITGDFGDILSLDGIPVSRLITGTSTFADPPGVSPKEPAEAADDFSLYQSACADGQPWMKTVFPQAVTTVFMLEKSGNDSGTIQGLDADGNDVGDPVAFVGNASGGPWTSTGYWACFIPSQQLAWGTVITSDVPIYGILITQVPHGVTPGIDPVSIVAVFIYQAWNPQPADGGLIPTTTTSTLLQWDPGDYAVQHDVYFADNFEDVNKAKSSDPMGSDKVYKARQTDTFYSVSGLVAGTTYYWRIDTITSTDTYRGYIWKFRVKPLIAYDPDPYNGQDLVAVEPILSWEKGSGCKKGHVVFFGDSFSEVNDAPVGTTGSSPPYRLYLTDVNDTNCAPTETGHPSLDANTPYYWRIDEVESLSPETIHKGNIWSFTTRIHFDIPSAATPPIIDGIKEDVWSVSEEQKCLHTVVGDDPTSQADLSAIWWSLWDSDYLYVFVDVNDDDLRNDSGEGWQDDSVDIMIDIGNDKESAGGYGADDYQYRAAWDAVSPEIQEYHHGNRSLPGVEFAVLTKGVGGGEGGRGTGYTVEIKFPWDTLDFADRGVASGDLLGFDVQINDDDATGDTRDTLISWYDTTNAAWNNPSLLGTVVLAAGLKASNPDPRDGATGVLAALMQWTAGKYADTHDVYFGTNPTPGAGEFIRNQTETEYEHLGRP